MGPGELDGPDEPLEDRTVISLPTANTKSHVTGMARIYERGA
jgi:hypothetical protein